MVRGLKFLFLSLTCVGIFFTGADLALAASKTPIVTGLSAAVGTAIDESNNHLYFVEYNAPDLKRILLTPECESDVSVPCIVEVVATGFSHAEDVELDIDHGYAYVTTRDNPGTGGLWRVDIATGTKSLVTFNLGAPQQLVLDTPNNHAYVVGYDDGRLRRIDLMTGAKTPVYKYLENPVGLAVTGDRAFAYVTEQRAPARISKIDLTLGVKVEDVVTDGVAGTSLVAPFFLAWTDGSQNSLYVAEREPANRISRLDLAGTPTLYDITSGLAMPWRPTALAVKGAGTPLYATAENRIVKIELIELTGPIFMAVGHVPVSSIINGYADTVSTLPGYFYKVRHSPFGGRLNIFGNFTRFLALGAKYYAVEMTKDGTTSYLSNSWTASRWDSTEMKYKPFTVAPAVDGYKYEIQVESDGLYHPELWWYPYWMMRWPSGEDGTYTFRVKIYNAGGVDITSSLSSLPVPNELTLVVDNTPPEVKIAGIWQKGPPDKLIKPCDIVTTGNNEYYFKITAYDPNNHLLFYRLRALWGDNKRELIDGYRDSYSNHIAPLPPHAWSGVMNYIPKDSIGNPVTWSAKCNCAHTFELRAGKRTINGYHYILRRTYHKSVTISNSSTTCGLTECGFPCP